MGKAFVLGRVRSMYSMGVCIRMLASRSRTCRPWRVNESCSGVVYEILAIIVVILEFYNTTKPVRAVQVSAFQDQS